MIRVKSKQNRINYNKNPVPIRESTGLHFGAIRGVQQGYYNIINKGDSTAFTIVILHYCTVHHIVMEYNN